MKLKIKLVQERNIVWGCILQQNENLRCDRYFRPTVLFDNGIGFKILSFHEPSLSSSALCIRGKNKDKDDKTFCVQFNTVEEAEMFALMVTRYIERFNNEGLKYMPSTKTWSE